MQMFIPKEQFPMQQTCSKSSPEVIKSGEQCCIYTIHRHSAHLCSLLLSWKEADNAQISLCGEGVKELGGSPFARPTGGQHRAAAETGTARAGEQFANTRTNGLKPTG